MRTKLDLDGQIARITMDDGKVNAMSEPMLQEIEERFQQAARDARVTVLRGRDGTFSAGFDLTTFTRGPLESLRMVRAGVRVIERMLSHPHPIVAVCTGHAYPMGAFLLLSSDLRLGVTGSWRIGLNEVAIGIAVPHFALALAQHRLTGPGFARITTASMFDPETAVDMGYLDEVAAPDDLDARAAELAEELLSLDPDAYRATKSRVNEKLLAAVRAAGSEESLRQSMSSTSS